MGWYTSYIILCGNDEEADKISSHLNGLFDTEVLTARGGGFESIKEPQIRPIGVWRVDGGIVLGSIKWGDCDEIKKAIQCFIAQNNLTFIRVLMKDEHDDYWDFII